jgi:hypothetical protein
MKNRNRARNQSRPRQEESNYPTIQIQMGLLPKNSNTKAELNIADLTKFWVGSVGLLYVLGFLVVTFRLSQFGVAPVTWLRPQYLLAGIWCLLSVLLFTGAGAFTAFSFTSDSIGRSTMVPRETRVKRYVVGTIEASAVLFCSFAFISSLVGKAVDPSSQLLRSWHTGSMVTLKLALCLLATIACAIWTIDLYANVMNSWESLRKERLVSLSSFGVLSLFSSLFFVVLYVYFFSVSVYSGIPSNLGGGKPRSVVFLIEKADQKTAAVVVDSSGTRSVPYNLLLVTESSYIVESPAKGELALEFKKDSVRGMVVLR